MTETAGKDRLTVKVLFVGLLLGLPLFIGTVLCSRFIMTRRQSTLSKLFRFCCIVCAIIVTIHGICVFLFQYEGNGYLWMGRLCVFLVLLTVCVLDSAASQMVTVTLLFAAVASAWTIFALQFTFFSRDLVVLLFDFFFAVALNVGLVFFVGWNWIVVNEISFILTKINLRDYNILFNLEDTLPLSDELDVSVSLKEVSFRERRSIPSAFLRKWCATYVLLAFVRILYDFGGLLPAYLLRHLVDNLIHAEGTRKKAFSVANVNDNIWDSAFLVFIIILSTITVTFLRIHYNLKLQRMALYIRGLLSAELYRVTLCRRKHEFNGKAIGDIINHLSVDVHRVGDVVQTLYDLWALPVQLILALYLLYIQVSFAFLAGMVVTLLLIPINGLLAKRMRSVQVGIMKENDERVSRITEVINNIAYIKMCGWSNMVQKWIQSPRLRYMQHLRWLKYLDAFCVFFWAVTPTLVSLFTFMTFVWMGGDLTPGKAVSALSLFGSLILPLNAFPWVINGFLEAYVSWQRLQPFLTASVSDNGYLSATRSLQQASREHKDFRPSTVDAPSFGNTTEMPFESTDLFSEENTDREKLLSEKGSPYFDINSRHINENDEKSNDTVFDIQQCVVSLESVTHQRRDDNDNSSKQNDFASDKNDIPLSVPSSALRIPTFQASRGQLIAIVGPSSSGKSTFLGALAGEFRLIGHSFSTAQHSIAYVEQQPFLMCASLQENILFGSLYNEGAYHSALHGAALLNDISFLTCGDEGDVGNRGDRLSGGQRVRVALARVLYSNCDIWLVDDIFGSLDAAAAHHVISKAIVPAVSRDKRCVIVATHNDEIIQLADRIYGCVDGEVTEINKHAAIPRLLPRLSAVESHIREEMKEVNEIEEEKNAEVNIGMLGFKPKGEADKKSVSSFIEVSERGSLAWATVTCYLDHVGWKLLIGVIGFAALMQAARNASDQFIVIWSKSGDGNTHFFLQVLGILTGVNSVLALCRGFSFALGGLKAAQKIHDEALGHVLAATYTFFTNSAPGRIITRLSTDIYAIDESLPFVANILLAQFFLLLGSIVVILLNSTAVIAICMVFLSVLYYKVQRPYRQLARELRRLDGITRAPLVDNIRIAFDGGVAIRSFGLNSVVKYLSRFYEDLRVSMRIQYNTLLLNAWFSLRLELIGELLLLFVGICAVLFFGGPGSALFGLALAYVQPLTSYANGVLGAFTSTEKELISVERIRHFFDIVTESNSSNTNFNNEGEGIVAIIDDKWPSRGVVEFKDVSARYDAHGPLVLDRLSFSIAAGERVALVGRSGAGKSSIFAALLRLVCIETGHVFIDDSDLSHLPLSVLRSHLGILPQHPFLFQGALRTNIDPFARHSDDAIRSVLECVGLRALDLELRVAAGGEGLSESQRHGVGLARVLLQRSRVMLLDEPSSQASRTAEATLWQVLNQHLQGTTVLCITHKLQNIDFFDRVLVVERGSIMANGTPKELRHEQIWPFNLSGQDYDYADI